MAYLVVVLSQQALGRLACRLGTGTQLQLFLKVEKLLLGLFDGVAHTLTGDADLRRDFGQGQILIVGIVQNLAVTLAEQGGVIVKQGTNRQLYRDLSQEFSMDIVASGGVSSIDDIIALRTLDLYAAIVGKAYYLGAIDLKTAIEVAK